MEKIRVIWDFYGPQSKGTAEHHVIHLKEFMLKENLEFFESDIALTDENHCMAYLDVNKSDVYTVRDSLKPHRAFVLREKKK